MKVNVSLAAFPGLRHEQAAALARGMALEGTLTEPLFDDLALDDVQLVPQNVGLLDEAAVDAVRAVLPHSRLRLHANVRVLDRHRYADLSNFDQQRDWFEQAAHIHRYLGATGYSAHAGRRAEASLDAMLDNARRCADLFGSPVAVEGHYPTDERTWLVDSWEEYRALFESGVPYALDLSHLNILVHRSGQREDGFTAEMLASDRLHELHLSQNDGSGDTHQVCTEEPWWAPLLRHTHAGAVVLSEGNHRRHNRLY